MIDIENMVFDTISKAVKAEYPNAVCYGEYIDIPASFPCVAIVEEENTTYDKSLDNAGHEHHANVVYSVNVYSNKSNGKKAECKAIADIVDRTFQNLKFTRTLRYPTPNVDHSIYRITERYAAVVAEPITVNGKKVYQIYRR